MQAAQTERTGDKLPAFTKESRQRLAVALMNLFDLWDLPTADRLMLLGHSENARSTLRGYRDNAPLAASRDLLERAAHLMAIHKNLRILYPENPEMVQGWITMKNTEFGGNRPVDTVRQLGLPGLLMVRVSLDKRRGH